MGRSPLGTDMGASNAWANTLILALMEGDSEVYMALELGYDTRYKDMRTSVLLYWRAWQ
jgi:hypothetical protein